MVGSDDDLNALFNEGAPLTDEDRAGLNLLRNGHIAVCAGQDKFGLDVKAGDLEHAFELRYVDKKLYARADVAGLAKLFVAVARRGQPADLRDGLPGRVRVPRGRGGRQVDRGRPFDPHRASSKA